MPALIIKFNCFNRIKSKIDFSINFSFQCLILLKSVKPPAVNALNKFNVAAD